MTVDTEVITLIDEGLGQALHLRKHLMTGIVGKMDTRGLNSTHYRTLMMLAHHESGCMKTFYGHLGLEAGSFTPVADRLIAEGLAERRTDPDDRRRTLLSITEAGRIRAGELKEVIRVQIGDRLSCLSDQRLQELVHAMDVFHRVNEELERNSNE